MSNNLDLKEPEERAHAVLSASGSHRWINCVGSVALSNRIDPAMRRGQTPYAAEGSAAHFLCEHCLEHGTVPTEYEGMKVVPEGPLFDAELADEYIKAETGHQYVFEVNEEMIDAVQMYLDYIAEVRKDCIYEHEEYIERQGNLLDLWVDIYGSEPDHEWLRNMFGTSDFILEAFYDGVLHIIDFKYGAGIAVDPDENEQLMYYAAAYAGSNLPLYDEVQLHIVQPRAYHAGGECRSWKTSGQHIYDFFKDVGFPAAITAVEVDALVEQCEQDVMDGVISEEEYLIPVEEYLNPMPEACQWCDAVHTCPKFRQEMIANAGNDFMVNPVPAKVTALPMPQTPEQLQRALNWAPMLKKWLKAVEANANNFTLNGHSIPGFKRVATRATRKWLSEEDVIKLCKKKRLKKGEYITEKLITPAQLEKVLGYEAIEDLFEKVSSSTTVVPVNDKRPEIAVSAKADFDDDDGEDELAIPGK